MTHPSEPNYVAMISGSNWGINNDDPANRFDPTNLADGLEAAHISWGAYMEALPADPLADFWPSSADPLYASKHNPFVLFTDIRGNPARLANVKPYTVYRFKTRLRGRDLRFGSMTVVGQDRDLCRFACISS